MDIGCVKQLVLGFFSDFPTIFLHQKIAFWVELGSVKMRFFQHTCHLWLSPKKNISGHGIQELSDCKLYKIILWMLAQWPKGMVRCETTCQLVKLLMNTYPPVDRGMHLLDLVRVNILQLLYFEWSPPWHVGWGLSGYGCHLVLFHGPKERRRTE